MFVILHQCPTVRAIDGSAPQNFLESIPTSPLARSTLSPATHWRVTGFSLPITRLASAHPRFQKAKSLVSRGTGTLESLLPGPLNPVQRDEYAPATKRSLRQGQREQKEKAKLRAYRQRSRDTHAGTVQPRIAHDLPTHNPDLSLGQEQCLLQCSATGQTSSPGSRGRCT